MKVRNESARVRARSVVRSTAAAAVLIGSVALLLAPPPAAAAPTWQPELPCADDRADAQPPDDEGKDPGRCTSARMPRQPQVSGAEAALLELDSETDVTHYFLDLELIPEYSGPTVVAVRAEGVNTVDFESTVDGLTSFTLDLHSGLTVNSVTGDVGGWSRVGNTIEIQLDRAYDTGEAVQVVVDYAGYPTSASFGAFEWWLRNGELVIATLSEPFYARYWWPCKDALDDKATMEMWVTVPSQLLALSNGSLTATQALPGGKRTQYRWHEQHPMIPYLASLAITSYESYDLQYDYEQRRRRPRQHAGGVPLLPGPLGLRRRRAEAGLQGGLRRAARHARDLLRPLRSSTRGSTRSTTRWRPAAAAVWVPAWSTRPSAACGASTTTATSWPTSWRTSGGATKSPARRGTTSG